MKIKNFQKLSSTDLRQKALKIAEAGLEAIDTQKIILAKIKLQKNFHPVRDREGSQRVSISSGALLIGQKTFPLKGVKNIYVVAIGKCAGEAALALEKVLGKKIKAGIALDVKPAKGLKVIKSFIGSHPFPSQRNISASIKIVNLIKNLNRSDLIIFVISGGGSTLLCLPKNGTFEEENQILKKLMDSGAAITEINTVRKHLSIARGGYLAKYAYPARSIALIFSDVVGNDLQFIASGPTVRDTTSIQDALNILDKYDVPKICPIENCGLVETPKDLDFFKPVTNLIFVSGEVALRTMAETAKKFGYKVKICTSCLKGEAREVGAKIASEINRARPKTVLLYGGETTVSVKNAKGKGGRNMELALSALNRLGENTLVLSLASDGRDNTEFAGAICDKITGQKADRLKLKPLNYLAENNSYPFFKKTRDYLLTGKTGSNVSDLVIAIKS